MAEVKTGQNSYLNFSRLWNYNGYTFFDVPDWPQIPEAESDRYITITSSYVGRLDLIAYDEYGTPDLWWILALANGMDKIPSDVKLNQRIRIPAKSTVDDILRSASNGT